MTKAKPGPTIITVTNQQDNEKQLHQLKLNIHKLHACYTLNEQNL